MEKDWKAQFIKLRREWQCHVAALRKKIHNCILNNVKAWKHKCLSFWMTVLISTWIKKEPTQDALSSESPVLGDFNFRRLKIKS